ncbi:MAG TPA: choice-of-anchor Q domain-containing protein, partial [Solirubrobacterales bacterium]|nr:choice-of-anchor Q domain-containing protein [Solirubrobacterales bacterium]
MTKAWKVAALASLASLGIAASASADVRYAEPNGDGDQVTCSQSDPCGLIDAIESPFAVDGDEVVVLPGVYSLGNEILLIDNELNVHGAPGNFSAGRPTIVGSHDFGLIDVSSDGARVADLELDHNGEFFALIVDGQAVVERLIVRSAATDGACHVAAQENAAVIRDSVCLNEGGGPAVRVQPDLFVDPGNATLRNVTAISNGSHPGILGAALNDGALNLDVLNTIASGGPGADDVVASDESASDPASLVLGNSNYDTASADANSSVTAPGTGTNQMAPPLLTNIEGAFAQLAGSPTIDAGAADPLLGSLDILGEPRIQGPAPDIGADETANPPDTTAPGLR